MIKFRTFSPRVEYEQVGNYSRSAFHVSATVQVNDWLEENPDVEIISWNTTAVGKEHELWITIQYKEKDTNE